MNNKTTVQQLIDLLQRVPDKSLPVAITCHTEDGESDSFALPQNIYTIITPAYNKKHLVFSELPPEEHNTLTQKLLAIHHP